MSNLLDKSSIVLTPTAYDNGKVLCVKPSDGSGDFDFSRNSAATRVNAQGLVENVQTLSSNLVQNGNFSQIGSEEVTNGNFLQEGSELLVNGDFATNSSWNGSATISNGQLTKGAGGGLVYQGALDGNVKLWKIIVDVAEKNGASLTLYLGGVQIALNEGIQTLYIKNGTSNTFVGFNNGAGSIINSISVKEVGQNWNFNNWTLTNDNALLVDTGGYINQVGVFVVGKSYKISVNVKDYTSGSLRFDSNGQNLWTPSGSNTIATIYVYNLDRTNFLLEGDFRGTITDISIKEVGQDWTLGSGVTIGENKIIGTNANSNTFQNVGIQANKNYKIQFTILDYSNGNVKVIINGSPNVTSADVSSNGNYTLYLSSVSGSNGFLSLNLFNNFNGSVTNISVIEITDDTNLPRINYDGFSFDGSGNIIPDSGCGSWLFEPQSTNLIPYSEDFSQWDTLGDTTIEGGYLAPDGSSSAYKVSGTDSSLRISGVTLDTTTRSVYARTTSGTGQANLCSFNGNSNNLFTITEQWQRFDVNSSIINGATSFYAVDFRGDTNLSEIILWGANATNDQSYPTSYIPADGTSVTRNQDLCTNGGSAASINITEGVLYAEIAALANDGTVRYLGLSDGSTNNRVIILYYSATNKVRAIVSSGGTKYVDVNYQLTNILDFHKVAIKYKLNDFAFWIDGVEVATDTSLNAPIVLDDLSFSIGGSSPFFGKTKAVAVWKEALTDTELAELTTI